jgi:hypothetical protein
MEDTSNLSVELEGVLQFAEDVVDPDARPDVYLQQIQTLHPALRNLFAVRCVSHEVAGDGFWYLFEAGSGVVVPEAILGFRALGMENTANALAQAAAKLGDVYPRGSSLRERRLLNLLSPTVLKEYQRGDREGAEEVFDELTTTYFHFANEEQGGLQSAITKYFAQWQSEIMSHLEIKEN